MDGLIDENTDIFIFGDQTIIIEKNRYFVVERKKSVFFNPSHYKVDYLTKPKLTYT